MGLFGDIDATEVPDDPFYVAPGTYACVLAESNRSTSKDGSKEGLAFKWVIEEEGEFEGKSVSEWLQIFPELTADEVTPQIRQQLARVKSRLLQMGVDEEDMDSLLEDDNLANLIGTTADVQVVTTEGKPGTPHEGKKFSNIRQVVLS